MSDVSAFRLIDCATSRSLRRSVFSTCASSEAHASRKSSRSMSRLSFVCQRGHCSTQVLFDAPQFRSRIRGGDAENVRNLRVRITVQIEQHEGFVEHAERLDALQ